MKDLVFHDPRDVLDLFEKECRGLPPVTIYETLRRKKILRFQKNEGYLLSPMWRETAATVPSTFFCVS